MLVVLVGALVAVQVLPVVVVEWSSVKKTPTGRVVLDRYTVLKSTTTGTGSTSTTGVLEYFSRVGRFKVSQGF
jgi:hypothetical protein